MSANVIPFPVQRSLQRAAVVPFPAVPARRFPVLVRPFPKPPAQGPEPGARLRRWVEKLRRCVASFIAPPAD